MLALAIASAPKRLTWLPLVLTTTPQAPSMLLYKAPVPSRHAGISTAVSASQTRLSSACGLSAWQASIFANPVRSLPLASSHARGSTPRWGLWCLQCLQRPHGALAAAQTHFRSPSLLPSIISSHIHTHF